MKQEFEESFKLMLWMGWSGCACVSGMLWNQFNAFSPICPGWSATIYNKQMAQNQQICDAMDGKKFKCN